MDMKLSLTTQTENKHDERIGEQSWKSKKRVGIVIGCTS
ncbi:hypothetical protein LT85_1908 [Collimonas arenae]|uniref:Uncharacterized protein n=1 Tax=Collimonas arenae TaxID=279058 RepID=A0A0A1F945_9BURK|nr:hypothetical protein LT85_1908 [Collimonas arenae]